MNFDQAVARIRAMCGPTRTNFVTHEEVYHSGIYDDGSNGHCATRYAASIFGGNGTPAAAECNLVAAESPEALVDMVRAYLGGPITPEERIARDLGVPVEKLMEIATEEAKKPAFSVGDMVRVSSAPDGWGIESYVGKVGRITRMCPPSVYVEGCDDLYIPMVAIERINPATSSAEVAREMSEFCQQPQHEPKSRLLED